MLEQLATLWGSGSHVLSKQRGVVHPEDHLRVIELTIQAQIYLMTHAVLSLPTTRGISDQNLCKAVSSTCYHMTLSTYATVSNPMSVALSLGWQH